MNLNYNLASIDRKTLDRIATVVNDYHSRAVSSDTTVKRVSEIVQQGKDERKLFVQRAAKKSYRINEAIQEADLNETWG